MIKKTSHNSSDVVSDGLSGLSLEHFQMLDEALTSLINDGLVEEITINGEVKYQLTSIGRSIGMHLQSDSSTHN